MSQRTELDKLLLGLRLPAIRRKLKEETMTGEMHTLLYELFMVEVEERERRSEHRRIKTAQFPYQKTLEDLTVAYLPPDGQKHIRELSTLSFIKEGRNVIFSGSPGTGKTHCAIGLGIEACMAGYKVWFTSLPSLINQLKEFRSERTLRSFELKFQKYDLVILDELGYISFDKEGAELLFSHLSLRSNGLSTIITTNLSFDRWNEVFHDPVLTAALTDRLTHRAYLLNMVGDSYRLKETLELTKM